MMKRFPLHFFLLFLLGIASLSASAQGKFRVTGEVLDSLSGKGVAFATVALMDTTSVPVAAWACDANGRFDHTLKAGGTYRLVVSSVGYTPGGQPVTINGSVTSLGTIRLVEGVALETVSITVTKPLIKSDIDKITYSVEADPEAPINTLLDILRKVPMVSVDAEDNIQLQGQSNYKVLVNGKSSALMDRNFKEVARGMPASSVKDVEVITNPSSKYEAEGVGGILNIITNRKSINGFNGSVGLNGDTFGGYGGNGYLSAKMGKFSLSGSLYGGYSPRPTSHASSYQENFLSDEIRYVRSESENKNMSNDYLGYQVEASYEIDTFNLLSLSLWGFNGHYQSTNYATTGNYDLADLLVREFQNTTRNAGKFGGLSGNFDYQRIFKKPGKTLTVSYKLEGSPGASDYESQIDGILNYNSYGQRSENDTWSRSHTLQVDYVDPVSAKSTVEAGTKFILRQNGNDPQTYERETSDDPWVLNPNRMNALDYDQYIWGIYGAYAYKLKKFGVKAGARAETTWNDGTFTLAPQGTPLHYNLDNNFFNLIPYLTLSLTPKPADRYTIYYTQRLSRPGIWYMNPYVDDRDPMNISTGNPDLDPEITNSVSFTYSHFTSKNSLSLSAYTSFTNNSIERVTTVGDDGRSFTSYYNIGQRDRYSISANYSWRPSTKFSVNTNLSGGYMYVEGAANRNEGFNFNGNLNARVALWKGGALNLNGNYASPNIQLQGRTSSFYYYGIGLSQKALKEKVTFNLSATNPFTKDMNFWNEQRTDTFFRRSDSYYPMRSVRLGVTYNFGKTQVQVKKARRGINNDDVKAGEGNSGGGGGGATGGQ